MRRRKPPRGLTVGVVGATGMVGRELLHLLETRRSPFGLAIGELRPFSSGTKKRSVRFRGRSLQATSLDLAALAGCQVIFFVSSDAVSRKLAPGLARKGAWVIDDSSAFRLHPRIPLVIPEVNGRVLARCGRLIAGPNCTMTPLAVAGIVLHRRACITAVRLATYQSVSGAGRPALEELFAQVRGFGPLKVKGRAPVIASSPCRSLPRPIAYNVIPQVGSFDARGDSGEEFKVAAELAKVWSSPRLKVSTTAVRVPSIRGHALAAWLTLKHPLTPLAARRLLSTAPGVRLCPSASYPTPLDVGGKEPVFVGRVRQGTDRKELCLWLSYDNLIKGAALNSIQIADELIKLGRI